MLAPKWAGRAAVFAATTLTMHVLSPAARHAEFVPRQAAAAEGVQYGFCFATEMGAHPDALFAQRALQGFGQRGAEDNVHAQFRDAAGERFGFKRAEQHLASLRIHSAPPRNDKQSRRRVKHRRHALLPDGNGHGHRSTQGRPHASRRIRRVLRRLLPTAACCRAPGGSYIQRCGARMICGQDARSTLETTIEARGRRADAPPSRFTKTG